MDDDARQPGPTRELAKRKKKAAPKKKKKAAPKKKKKAAKKRRYLNIVDPDVAEETERNDYLTDSVYALHEDIEVMDDDARQPGPTRELAKRKKKAAPKKKKKAAPKKKKKKAAPKKKKKATPKK